MEYQALGRRLHIFTKGIKDSIQDIQVRSVYKNLRHDFRTNAFMHRCTGCIAYHVRLLSAQSVRLIMIREAGRKNRTGVARVKAHELWNEQELKKWPVVETVAPQPESRGVLRILWLLHRCDTLPMHFVGGEYHCHAVNRGSEGGDMQLAISRWTRYAVPIKLAGS